MHGQGVGRPAGAWWPNGVSARFSDDQFRLLDKTAGDLSVSMAGLLRMLVDGYLGKLIERERKARSSAGGEGSATWMYEKESDEK